MILGIPVVEAMQEIATRLKDAIHRFDASAIVEYERGIYLVYNPGFEDEPLEVGQRQVFGLIEIVKSLPDGTAAEEGEPGSLWETMVIYACDGATAARAYVAEHHGR